MTLSHGEKYSQELTGQDIVTRILKLFECTRVLVVREPHANGGYHWHVGICTTNASKHTYYKKLTQEFFEWPSIHVVAHKKWETIERYLLKHDKNPLVFEKQTALPETKEESECVKDKISKEDLLKVLLEKKTWDDVIADNDLVLRILFNYKSIKQLYEDLTRQRKEKEKLHFFKSLSLFLKNKKGNPYTKEDLKEKYFALEWLVKNLCEPRYLHQKQLLIYGETGTNKTNFVSILEKFLSVYHVPRRKDEFVDADLSYDLWVYDEFCENLININTWNAILDGQKVFLDRKLQSLICKTKNVPVIMINNEIPCFGKKTLAFLSRVELIEFKTKFVDGLNEVQLCKTLYEMLKEGLTREIGSEEVNRIEHGEIFVKSENLQKNENQDSEHKGEEEFEKSKSDSLENEILCGQGQSDEDFIDFYEQSLIDESPSDFSEQSQRNEAPTEEIAKALSPSDNNEVAPSEVNIGLKARGRPRKETVSTETIIERKGRGRSREEMAPSKVNIEPKAPGKPRKEKVPIEANLKPKARGRPQKEKFHPRQA